MKHVQAPLRNVRLNVILLTISNVTPIMLTAFHMQKRFTIKQICNTYLHDNINVECKMYHSLIHWLNKIKTTNVLVLRQHLVAWS